MYALRAQHILCDDKPQLDVVRSSDPLKITLRVVIPDDILSAVYTQKVPYSFMPSLFAPVNRVNMTKDGLPVTIIVNSIPYNVGNLLGEVINDIVLFFFILVSIIFEAKNCMIKNGQINYLLSNILRLISNFKYYLFALSFDLGIICKMLCT